MYKRLKIIISACLILIITFVSFFPSLNNSFTNWDDDKYLTDNLMVRELSFKNIKLMFTDFHSTLNLYQPLVFLSYSIEYYFFKLNPVYYHITNLILHLFNTLLVFWLIFMINSNIFTSFFTAILFGIHPLHVESVAWVTERKDVLYTFFFLSSLISYIYYKKKQDFKYYYYTLFLFILSILTKIMALTLPFVLLLCDYFLHKKFYKNSFVEKIPFFIISFILVIITVIVTYNTGDIWQAPKVKFFYTILFAIYGLTFYIMKMILPLNLSCFYPYPDNINSLLSISFVPFMIIIVLIIAVIFSSRYTKKITFGFLFFLITILPVIQLIPASKTITADRYTYVPLIGLFYIVGEGFSWIYLKLKYNKIVRILLSVKLIVIIGVLSFLTRERTKVWKDSITLWSNVLENYPDVFIAYYNRGIAYNDISEYDRAIFDYNHALRIRINDADVYYHRGNTYSLKKEYDKAIFNYTQALNIKPDFAEAYFDKGNVYSIKKEYEKSISEYTRALNIKKDYIQAYNNRGIAFAENGNYYKAISDFSNVLRIDNNDATAYYNRGIAYLKVGKYAKALEDIQKSQNLGCEVDTSIIRYILSIIAK